MEAQKRSKWRLKDAQNEGSKMLKMKAQKRSKWRLKMEAQRRSK
jgi:hypothetical protein